MLAVDLGEGVVDSAGVPAEALGDRVELLRFFAPDSGQRVPGYFIGKIQTRKIAVSYSETVIRRGGRVVDCAGLENRKRE